MEQCGGRGALRLDLERHLGWCPLAACLFVGFLDFRFVLSDLPAQPVQEARFFSRSLMAPGVGVSSGMATRRGRRGVVDVLERGTGLHTVRSGQRAPVGVRDDLGGQLQDARPVGGEAFGLFGERGPPGNRPSLVARATPSSTSTVRHPCPAAGRPTARRPVRRRSGAGAGRGWGRCGRGRRRGRSASARLRESSRPPPTAPPSGAGPARALVHPGQSGRP